MGFDFERAVNQEAARQRQQAHGGERIKNFGSAVTKFVRQLMSPEMLDISGAELLDSEAKTALRGLISSNLAAGRSPEPIYRPGSSPAKLPDLRSLLQPKPDNGFVNGWLISLGRRDLFSMGDPSGSAPQPFVVTPARRLGTTPVTYAYIGQAVTAVEHNQQASSRVQYAREPGYTPFDEIEQKMYLEKLFLKSRLNEKLVPHLGLSQIVVNSVVEDLAAHNVPWVQPD